MSEDLRLGFVTIRSREKPSALLFVLREILKQGDTGDGGGSDGDAEHGVGGVSCKASSQRGKGSNGGRGKAYDDKGGKKLGHLRGDGSRDLTRNCRSDASRSGHRAPLTVVFTATRHHCEFLHLLLIKAGMKATVIYGTMDQVLKYNITFRERIQKARVGKFLFVLRIICSNQSVSQSVSQSVNYPKRTLASK